MSLIAAGILGLGAVNVASQILSGRKQEKFARKQEKLAKEATEEQARQARIQAIASKLGVQPFAPLAQAPEVPKSPSFTGENIVGGLSGLGASFLTQGLAESRQNALRKQLGL